MSVPKAVPRCVMLCGEFTVSVTHPQMNGCKEKLEASHETSKLQLSPPHSGIHSVVLTNLQSGRQGQRAHTGAFHAALCLGEAQRPLLLKG